LPNKLVTLGLSVLLGAFCNENVVGYGME